MYKAKLQEVCQRKKWGLPSYSCIKDGPDHSPHFRASVSVNGVSFDSPAASNSYQHALNEAAMLAFLHFASDVKPIAEGPEIEVTFSSSKSHSNASDAQGPEIEETHLNSEIRSNASSDSKVGVRPQYKMQLQNFAQSKNLDPPMYSSKTEGPPHALQFKATATIDGHSFESPGYFKTLKEAEHVAAKFALMSLAADSFRKIEARLHKNLLQELAQSEGFTLPEYKTVRCGPPHQLIFFSTVEVEGEIFHGKGAITNKLAEQSAAKVAYTVFMERKSTRCGDITSSGSSAEELPISSPGTDVLTNVDPQLTQKPACPLSSCASEEFEQQAKEIKDEEVTSAEKLPVNAKGSSQDTDESPALPNMEEATGSGKSSSSSSSIESLAKSSTLAITDLKIAKNVETKSYLLCNRFRVYTCIPDITFPKGTVLLPIDDCKWVAVSLDFPNGNV